MRGVSIGSYLPRECGIATYTAALSSALATATGTPEDWRVVAMNDLSEGYSYPPEVCSIINQHDRADYSATAHMLNNAFDVVLPQHEYGIFGGDPCGSYVLDFLGALEMPVITTLHTVLREPSVDQKRVLQGIVAASDRVVVLSRLGLEYLVDIYRAPAEKLAFIPHGVPPMPLASPEAAKQALGLTGRTVLLTAGFVSPNKGLEYVLEALPQILAQDPSAVYVIVGVTHPHVRRTRGEEYRESLVRRGVDLGLGDHLRFVNQFLPSEVLNQYLASADVYVIAHVEREQIISGTLSHALGAGKAVVSTPFWYAEEVLAKGRGVLVPFRDAAAFGGAVVSLLRDPAQRDVLRRKTHAYSRSMLWNDVADSYLALCRELGTR